MLPCKLGAICSSGEKKSLVVTSIHAVPVMRMDEDKYFEYDVGKYLQYNRYVSKNPIVEGVIGINHRIVY